MVVMACKENEKGVVTPKFGKIACLLLGDLAWEVGEMSKFLAGRTNFWRV